MTRRTFEGLALAAGFLATAARAAQGGQVIDSTVDIKTADGICDAAFLHPATGSYPGVVIWTDIVGLRPAFRDLGKRLAAEGYAVLVPNPFYRRARAPVFDSTLDMRNPVPQAMPFVATIAAAGAVERDAVAFAAFFDSQPAVSKAKKFAAIGYCMGGSLAMRTAATLSDRLGAGASFHGGGLVTEMPNSPHLLASKIKSPFYFAVAASDDREQPDAKTRLKAAFDAAHVPVEIEVYPGTLHAWCVSDTVNYDRPAAERAWGKLSALCRQSLA
jgi:carboxymethylenebutenolidase